MASMRLDLTAVRCPDALLKARKGIQTLLASTQSELQILAIEPSLSRDLPYAIEHNDWAVSIVEEWCDVPSSIQERWKRLIEEGEEGLFSDITKIRLFLIKRTH